MTDSAGLRAPATDTVGGGGLRLPRPPGVIRRFWARRPRTADTILAVFVVLVAASGALAFAEATAETVSLAAAALVLIAISVAGIYVRRTRPLVTAALSGVSIVPLAWSPTDMVLAPTLFAVYAVAVHRSTRTGALVAAVLWAAATLVATIREFVAPSGWSVRAGSSAGKHDLSGLTELASSLFGFAVLLALALAIGANIGNRRRYLTALIDRARQLAIERDQQGWLATAIERARIAREMHDIVSHGLTVMVALAEGSAATAAQTAPEAAAAMRTVADTGRAAMIDMRRMLGVLGGDGDADTAPQPGLGDLPALVDRFRALGMPVAFRGVGPKPEDPAVQLTVYRLVQESLTNALRYAVGPTSVLVTVTVDGTTLTASVTDNGLPGFAADAAGRSVGSGRGLIGLRERVASFGGSLEAGPRADGPGWQVRATLHLDDTAFGHSASRRAGESGDT